MQFFVLLLHLHALSLKWYFVYLTFRPIVDLIWKFWLAWAKVSKISMLKKANQNCRFETYFVHILIKTATMLISCTNLLLHMCPLLCLFSVNFFWNATPSCASIKKGKKRQGGKTNYCKIKKLWSKNSTFLNDFEVRKSHKPTFLGLKDAIQRSYFESWKPKKLWLWAFSSSFHNFEAEKGVEIIKYPDQLSPETKKSERGKKWSLV